MAQKVRLYRRPHNPLAIRNEDRRKFKAVYYRKDPGVGLTPYYGSKKMATEKEVPLFNYRGVYIGNLGWVGHAGMLKAPEPRKK